jgi:cytochrome b
MPSPAASGDLTQPRTIRVWDLGVRLFHWALVAGVAVALLTGFFAGKTWLDVHLIAGTVIAALVVFRLVWGFSGSTYARFANFVVSPLAALRHALDLARGRAHHHIGHNPIGTMMILALLAVLTALTVTGVLALGGVIKDGPLAPFTTYATGRDAREIHELLAFALLGLVGLHVVGIVMESLRTRESLVRGMIDGRKRADRGGETVTNAEPRRLAAALASAVLFAGSGAAIAHWSRLPALGVSTAPLDAAYVKECGACHTPHHPSLAPAATWTAIMAGLGQHFGDNAELDPAQAKALLDYTTANSAEKWDSSAANRLRKADPKGSLRITETAGWQRAHRKVDDAAFKAKKVAGKLNCGACHGDAASGRFVPRSISIPKE